MFEVLHKDSRTKARRGRLKLKRGVLETPAFMPVGTYGAVRGLAAWELEACQAPIMLCNTYHLASRPGLESIQKLGGLHQFNSWKRPILTDSGGFQVFSLSSFRKITDESVQFRDPLDGKLIELTPEKVVGLQEGWGSDVMMVLDECPPAEAPREQIINAVRRTHLWAERSLNAWSNPELNLFPIVQGGTHIDLRVQSLDGILAMETPDREWSGIAIGGLSVGEKKEKFISTLYNLKEILPESKVHYLMGVGTPRDLVFGVACGIDMFDCVIPSRNARHGIVMTKRGRLSIQRAEHKEDSRPLEEGCDCWTCQRYSRAFIRHLFFTGDSLGQRLATLHNVRYFLRLMEEVQLALEQGEFHRFLVDFLANEETLYLGGEKHFKDYPAFPNSSFTLGAVLT